MMIQARDGQPATGSPNISFLIIMKITIRKEKIVRKMPSPDARDIGVSEKLMIPSTAYLNKPQKLHFVSPAMRFTFSYSSHLVLKPIQPKIPFENRLYSHMATILSTISRFIRRKSLAPSTTSASEILLISL